MSTLTGPAIDVFRARVITRAIGLYLITGMRVNRAYTPQVMRSVASEYTGKTYTRNRKGLETAHKDLTEWLAVLGLNSRYSVPLV